MRHLSFLPQFNGVKPPYIGSEFEVIGVPEDSGYKKLSPDKGRYDINPLNETMNAFRTGTVRNALIQSHICTMAYFKPWNR